MFTRLIGTIGVIVTLLSPSTTFAEKASPTVPLGDTIYAYPVADLTLPLTPQDVLPAVLKFRERRRGDAYVMIESTPQALKCLGLDAEPKFSFQLQSAARVGLELKRGLVSLGIAPHYIFVKPTVVEGVKDEVRIFLLNRYEVEEMGAKLPPESLDTDDDGTPDWIDDCPRTPGPSFIEEHVPSTGLLKKAKTRVRQNNGCPEPEFVDPVYDSAPDAPVAQTLPQLLKAPPSQQGESASDVVGVQDAMQAIIKKSMTDKNGVSRDFGWYIFGGEASVSYGECRPSDAHGPLQEICWKVRTGTSDGFPLAGADITLRWEWDGPRKKRSSKAR